MARISAEKAGVRARRSPRRGVSEGSGFGLAFSRAAAGERQRRDGAQREDTGLWDFGDGEAEGLAAGRRDDARDEHVAAGGEARRDGGTGDVGGVEDVEGLPERGVQS